MAPIFDYYLDLLMRLQCHFDKEFSCNGAAEYLYRKCFYDILHGPSFEIIGLLFFEVLWFWLGQKVAEMWISSRILLGFWWG